MHADSRGWIRRGSARIGGSYFAYSHCPRAMAGDFNRLFESLASCGGASGLYDVAIGVSGLSVAA